MTTVLGYKAELMLTDGHGRRLFTDPFKRTNFEVVIDTGKLLDALAAAEGSDEFGCVLTEPKPYRVEQP